MAISVGDRLPKEFGMGKRSMRYAMIVKDATLNQLLVEPKGGLDVSSAEAVLDHLG